MIPTLDYLKSKFDSFNREIFQGRLPEVPIRITRARSYLGLLSYKKRRGLLGRVKYSDFVLSVSVAHDFAEDVVEDTLIHEMIHLYIHFNGLDDASAHGPLFRQMMDDINRRHGRHITVRRALSDAEKGSDRQVRAHFVCRVRLKGGVTGVIVAQRSAVFGLWAEVERSPMIEEFAWYGSINPYFNRFSRSRTLRKYFKVDAGELDRELATARPLERRNGVIRVLT